MIPVVSAVAGVLGALVFFGAIVLIVWIGSKSEEQKRQLAHAERLRSLELGQPLPDAEVARARAETVRVIFAGVVGVVVPLGLMGIAIGATAMLTTPSAGTEVVMGAVDVQPLCIVIWSITGLVSLVTAILSLVTMQRRRLLPQVPEPSPAVPGQPAHNLTEAFTERPNNL
jgi:hypothetical protein